MYVCMHVCMSAYACMYLYMLVYVWVCVCILQCMSRYDSMCITCVYDKYIERETERERERNNVHDFVCILCTSASIHVCHHVEYTNVGSVSRGGANFLKDLPVGNPASCNPHLQIGTDYCQHQTGARPHDKLRYTAQGLLRLNI